MRQIDANKGADDLAVVDHMLDVFVGQTEALLRDVPPRHAFQADQRTATAVAFRVVRQEGGNQRWARRVRFSA